MGFPTIPAAADGRVITAAQANATATRTFPDLSGLTKASGDLLIAVVIAYQASGNDASFGSWTAGWNEFIDRGTSGSTMAIGAAYKWSTGAETGQITTTQAGTPTGHAVMFIMAIPGAHATLPPEATALATGTALAADPAALSPSWGQADTLWISVAGGGEVATTGSWTGVNGASAPPNYSGAVKTGQTQDAVGGTDGGVAFRQVNAASENCGTWTSVDTSNARNAALVIAVAPSPNATVAPATLAAPASFPTATAVVPLLLANSFEGGTDTTALTAGSGGNTGGDSGSFFDSVAVPAGGTNAFSATQKAHGSLSLALATGTTTGACFVEWGTSLGSQAECYGRFYLYLPAALVANNVLARFVSGATLLGGVQITTGGVLRVFDTLSNIVATFTTTVPTGQWVRIEWHGTFPGSATAAGSVRLYTTADSATVTEEQSWSAANFGSLPLAVLRYGLTNSVASQPAIYLDDVGVVAGGWLGPAAAGGATATPAGLTCPATFGVPVVRQDQAPAATVLAAPATVPAVTVAAVRNAAATPAGLACPVSLPAPAAHGSAALTATVLAAPATVPAVVTRQDQSVAATGLAAPASFPAVTVRGHVIIAPAGLAAPGAFPVPAVYGSASAAVTVLAAPAAFPVATVTAAGNATATPAVLAAPASFPAPVVRQDAAPAAAVLAAPAALPTVVVTAAGNATAAPATLAAPASFGAATVTTGRAAATFYVHPTAGSDSSDGLTTGGAWQTVTKVNSFTFQPGDVVLFARGTTQTAQTLVIDNSGTEADPIRVGAYGAGARPIFDGGGTDSTVGVRQPVEVTGNWVVVEELQLQHSSYAGCDVYGDDVTVQNCTLTRNPVGGEQDAGAARTKFLSNTVADNSIEIIGAGGNDDSGSMGILLHGDAAEVANNAFSGHKAASPDYTWDGSAVEIYGATNAEIHRNTSWRDWHFTELGNAASANNRYHHNLIVNDGAGESSTVAVTAMVVQGAGTFGPVTNTDFVQNTIVYTGAWSQGIVYGSGCDGTVANNIVVTGWKAGYTADAIDEHHNLYYGHSQIQIKSLLSATQTTVDETSLTGLDPLFGGGLLASITSDYHLVSGGEGTGATVLAFGDPQLDGGTSYETYKRFANTTDLIADTPADLVVCTGDCTNAGGTQWAYFQTLTGISGAEGALRPRMKAVIGGHDHDYTWPYYYDGDGATWAGWGTDAGPDSDHCYYSFDLGGWHVIVLDDEDTASSGVTGAPYDAAHPGHRIPTNSGGSPVNPTDQYTWLAADLAAHPDVPVLVFAHQGRYSRMGQHTTANLAVNNPAWSLLVSHGGVEAVISGHTHDYERWARMGAGTPGSADAVNGIRQFRLPPGQTRSQAPDTTSPQPEAWVDCNDNPLGVLRLVLWADHWTWEMLAPSTTTPYALSGATIVSDSGSQNSKITLAAGSPAIGAGDQSLGAGFGPDLGVYENGPYSGAATVVAPPRLSLAAVFPAPVVVIPNATVAPATLAVAAAFPAAIVSTPAAGGQAYLRASVPSYASAASDTTFQIALPTGWAARDVCYIGVQLRGTSANITTPGGWTAVAPVFNPVGVTNTALAVYRRVLQAGDSSPVTFTVVSGRAAALAVCAASADGTTPEDGVTPAEAPQAAATLDPVAASVDPASANDLLLVFFGAGDPTTANVAMTFGTPAGMTIAGQVSSAVAGSTDAGIMVAYQALSSGDPTGTRTCHITPSSGSTAANSQTVTLVVKSGGTGAQDATATPAGLAAPASFPAPAVSAAAVAAPAVLPAAAAFPAAIARQDRTVAPATLAAPASFPAALAVVHVPLPMPARVVMGYWEYWAVSGTDPRRLADIPTAYNTISIFEADPSNDGVTFAEFGYRPLWNAPHNGRAANTNLIADIRTCHARGQVILLSVGGAGAEFNIDTYGKADQFIADFKRLNSVYCANLLDGIDFNCFEATQLPNVDQLTYIAQQLRAYYGATFNVTAPIAASTARFATDMGLATSLDAAGALTMVSPQFYDDPSLASPSLVTTRTNSASTSVGENNVGVGFSMGTDSSHWTAANAVASWQTQVAAHPALRGAFNFSIGIDESLGWPFANTVAPAVIGAAAPAVLACPASFPAPVVRQDAAPAPARLAAPATLPAVAVSAASNATAAPAGLAAPATLPAPVVRQDRLIVPAALACPASFPAAAVSAGGSTTVAPAGLAVPASFPAPVVRQDQKPSPAALGCPAAFPAAGVSGAANAAPAAHACPASFPAPAAHGSAVSAPAGLACAVSFPAVVVAAAAGAAPAGLACAVTFPAVAVRQDRTIAPAALACPAVLPAVSVSAAGNVTVAVAACQAPASFPAPVVRQDRAAAAAVLACPATVLAVTVTTTSSAAPAPAALAAPATVLAVTASGSAAAAPATATAPAVVAAVVVRQDQRLTVAVLAVTAAFPAAQAAGHAAPAAAALAVTAAFPAPGMSAGSTLLPAAVAVAVAFPPPALTRQSIFGVATSAGGPAPPTVTGSGGPVAVSASAGRASPAATVKGRP